MFERFTERARQVVILAQEEARSLHHEEITSGHVLLGLAREEEGLSARVLEALDTDAERLRIALLEVIPRGPEDVPGSGQVPFTATAKRDLELALREALSLGHNYIGTEHILLGVVRDVAPPDEGSMSHAHQMFALVDINPERIRAEVIRMLNGPRQPSSQRDALFAQREAEREAAIAARQRIQQAEVAPGTEAAYTIRAVNPSYPTQEQAALMNAVVGAVTSLSYLVRSLQDSMAPPATMDSHLYDLAPTAKKPSPDIREPRGDAQQQMQADRTRGARAAEAHMESPESGDAT